MKKIIHVCTVVFLMLSLVAPVSVFGHGEENADSAAATNVPESAQDLAVSLRVPLLSPLFVETPVAAVNGQPILLGEFAGTLSSAQSSDSALAEKFSSRLDALITERAGGAEKQVVVYAVPGSINDQSISIQIPIFSSLFVETPVAVVNGEAIRFADFTKQVISMYSSLSGGEGASHDYQGLLERLIAVKLVVLEAENIGIGETDSAEKRISTFADKALAKLLLLEQSKNVVPVQEEVEELYKLMSQEVKLLTIQIGSQEEAQTFLGKYQEAGGFLALAEALVAENKASLSDDEEYVHINDLLPKIKTDISQMEIGGVSQIYKASAEGYLVFKLLDRRFVEDPEVYQELQRKNLEKERKIKNLEYIETLEDKYVRYNTEALADLAFETLKTENPDLDMRGYLKQLRDDQRTLVTFEGDATQKLTVAEVADKINSSFYHGLEESVTAAKLNEEKEKALYNLQFQITSRLEAEKLGLDKTSSYLDEVEKFSTTLLFESFLERVIAPEVAITEDEVRQSYQERMSEFSSPAMLKMQSLVFQTEAEATVAFERLKNGSDFKWVSANSQGLVDKSAEGVLPFESNLLSVTALPEKIQDKAALSKTGDVLLFADPGKYFYVLHVDAAYPPQPKAYESVRSQVGQALYNAKFQQILDLWVSKLKEVYNTEKYLVQK